jgi:hypothetical protein
VKYVDGGANGVSGSRVPAGPRGILMVTNDKPGHSGYYSSVTPPTASGFTSDVPGLALLALGVDIGASRASGSCTNDRVTFGADNWGGFLPGKTGLTTNIISWTFTPSTATTVPVHAKSLDIEFSFVASSSGDCEIVVKRQNADETIFNTFVHIEPAATSATFTVRDIPLRCNLPWLADADPGGLAEQTLIQLRGGGGAMSNANARVVGYTL